VRWRDFAEEEGILPKTWMEVESPLELLVFSVVSDAVFERYFKN
jgi:hypothetical protein